MSKFDEIQNDSRDFVCGIPHEQFVSILKNDELNVEHESSLVDLVKDYVKRRAHIKPAEKWGPPSETTAPEVWNMLSDEEKKVRNEKF